LLDNPIMVGVYNAGWENHSLMDIAEMVRATIPCRIEVTEQRDVRSYMVDSSKVCNAGYSPKKTIRDAICELRDAYQEGTLSEQPQWNNLGWMKHLGVEDD
jgi:nucleoside-diphosphate-sugar epimerase